MRLRGYRVRAIADNQGRRLHCGAAAAANGGWWCVAGVCVWTLDVRQRARMHVGRSVVERKTLALHARPRGAPKCLSPM